MGSGEWGIGSGEWGIVNRKRPITNYQLPIMSANLSYPSGAFGVGGVVQEYLWSWKNQQIRVVYEVLGQGSPLLLLPAFSTVSTRQEMAELAKLFAPYFQVVALDWPGFGESSRPNIDYVPAVYQQFLENFIKHAFNSPISILAAGHSAAYVLKLAVKEPSLFSRLLLVAPTWRGPLPSMGANPQLANIVKEIVRTPILGQGLYKLNTLPSFLEFMYRRHVFADETKLTDDFIQHKWQTTKKSGARFGSAAFVTGTLDAVNSQADFLGLAQKLSVALMIVIGESTPEKSRAEMDALKALSGVKSVILPGTLGMHEEYAQKIFEASLPFLKALS
jgi:pimeloyl-ACP methyl ester carboxylesterase